MQNASSRRPLLVVAALALFFLAGPATSAWANFQVQVTSAKPATTGTTDAMAYTDFSMSIAFPADSSPKDLTLDLPKGQLGAVSNATICPLATFEANNCPASSKIGASTTNVIATGIPLAAPGFIYRIPAQGTEAARLGISAIPSLGDPMFLQGELRVRDDGSYGIRALVNGIPSKANLTLIPGLPPAQLPITVESLVMTMYGHVGGGGAGTPGFMFNPPECIPATTVVKAVAYDGSVATGSNSYTPTNCNAVPFTPTLAFTPNPSPASAPTFFTTTVSLPWDPNAAKVQSSIRTTKLLMPDGIQLSGAADSDGLLAACSDAQFDYSHLTPDTCPAGSKVGSVVMDSPLVGEVPGDVFLAQPQSGPNDIIQLFVVAELGPQVDATRIKLKIRVETDPTTGQLTTTLQDLPAQPVKSFKFTFRGGTNAGTRQPTLCGIYPGQAQVTPYSSTTASLLTSNYVVASNCPTPGSFHPNATLTTSSTQAGGFTTGKTSITLPIGDDPLVKTTASLPPGMLANIDGVQRCTPVQPQADNCPAPTQVGVVDSYVGQTSVPGVVSGTVYLMDPPDDQSIAGLYVHVPVVIGPIVVGMVKEKAAIRLRPDYGVDVIASIPETIRGMHFDLQKLDLNFTKANFLSNPPTCTGNTLNAAHTSLTGKKATSSTPIAVTGCDQLKFNPAISFSAAPASAEKPTALTTTITMPASTPSAIQSPIKSMALTLPEGVSLSPSAGAKGDLAGCSAAEFTPEDLVAPTCPPGSAVGTVSIDTAAVGHITGTAYLGTQPAGHLASLLIDATADDFDNVRVKLSGTVDVDPTTGRTVTKFDGVPPVSFTQFSLTLRAGDAPVLAMPRTCGTSTGSAAITPQVGADVTATAPLVIDQDCPTPGTFAPTLEVSTGTTQAAADTSLSTVIKVPSGNDELGGVNLTMPRGLLGRLTVVPRCDLTAAKANGCGDESLVGTVSAKVGVASAPYIVAGKVYMTTAVDDGIAGLAFTLPAKVGPIDLGTVVTIAKLQIVGNDLILKISTDAVPTQVAGVRLDLRELAISVDKPGTVVNPSTCDARQTDATFTSAGATPLTATANVPFQATGCDQLNWKPNFAMSFDGSAADVGVKGHPTITTVITQAPNQGNLRSADVLLPDGASTDLVNVNKRTCVSAAAAVAGDCSAGTQVGSAEILTSTLPAPVHAIVYLVAIPGYTLPGMAIRVRDQINFDLVGTTVIDKTTGRIRVTFRDMPDAPLSQVKLVFTGGPTGLIQIGTDICGTSGLTTNATLTSQHGATAGFGAPVICNGKSADAGKTAATGLASSFRLRTSGKGKGFSVAVTGAAGIRGVRFTLPKGVSYTKAAKKALKIKLSGATTKAKAKATIKIKGRTLTVSVPAGKVTRVVVTAPGKAVKITSAYAKKLKSAKARKRVALPVAVTWDSKKWSSVKSKTSVTVPKKKS
jgi:hypothetical protein